MWNTTRIYIFISRSQKILSYEILENVGKNNFFRNCTRTLSRLLRYDDCYILTRVLSQQCFSQEKQLADRNRKGRFRVVCSRVLTSRFLT